MRGWIPLVLLFAGCSGRPLDGTANETMSAPDLARPAASGACPTLDERSCAARSPECHPVFVDHSDLCDCAGLGCCTSFDHCANGPAHCSRHVPCKSMPPPCFGPYVPGTIPGACWEGCVLAGECLPD